MEWQSSLMLVIRNRRTLLQDAEAVTDYAHATYLLTFRPEVPPIPFISCVLILVAAHSLSTSAANWLYIRVACFRTLIVTKTVTLVAGDGFRPGLSGPRDRWPRFSLFPVAGFEGT